MSEQEPTPPQAQEELPDAQLESAAGGGIIEDAVQAVKDFFGIGDKPASGGGGSFGGGGASGSW